MPRSLHDIASATGEPTPPVGPVRLVRVKPDEAHTAALYRLLESRSHGISHVRMPSMARHRRFVSQHPYRVWYLVRIDREWIGSVYILPSNEVGISVLDGFDDRIGEILDRVFARHRPLPAVPSVRSGVFSFNVSPTNARLAAALMALGGEVVQQTYVLAGSRAGAGGRYGRDAAGPEPAQPRSKRNQVVSSCGATGSRRQTKP